MYYRQTLSNRFHDDDRDSSNEMRRVSMKSKYYVKYDVNIHSSLSIKFYTNYSLPFWIPGTEY